MAEPAAAQSTGIDCLSPEAQRLAEARLAAKRAARAEAREIRMKELERQQKEVEERPEKDFTEKGSRSLPGLSAATLASLGGTSSRRGSGDTSISMDTEASIREIKELSELKDQIQDIEGRYTQGLREMKDSLAEAEEKYKKAMVSNAQLDNEKTNFMYQVDTLKDMLLELEEQLAESRRQYDEKSKEFEREKHAHSILQLQFAEAKEALKQREEMLEKHGIVLNSEITTNGETADTLNNVGHQGPTKLTKEEVNALKAVGDGPLGRASEVEVKSEIVENVGEKGVLQHTEQEQHKEDPARERVDTEVFHPGRDAKDQKASEDRAPSRGVLANGPDGEQGQTWDLENAPSVEDAEQAESGEVTHTPDDRTAASLERSSGSGDLDGGSPGAGSGRHGYSASDVRSQSRESGEAQEGWQTGPGAGSAKPGQDSASPQVSEVGGLASVDVGEQAGSPPEGVAEAGLPGLGEQAGTVANGPPRYSSDTRRDDERHVVDAPTELDPSSGPDLEKEAPGQGVAELQEFPVESTAVGGESEEKDQERALRAEKPIQTEGQNIPCCPAAKSSPQGAAGPSVADPESKPLDTKEPEEGKNDQQGVASDSSQKKTKNKKKKNKKKKPPTPVESLNDVKKELTFQNPDLSEVKEEEQVNFTDEKSAVEAQDEVPESPKKESVAGTGGNVGGPENPEVELNENRDQEDSDVNTTAGKEAADGDTLGPGDDTTQSSGACAGDEEPDEAEAVVRDEAKEDGAAAGVPEPGSALLENGGPLADLDGASQTGSPQRQEMAECPSPTVRKAVENEDDSAASGELGAPESDPPSGGSEKGKSKEDCRLS